MQCNKEPLVFISCGQYTVQEAELGREICTLVQATHPEAIAYFAETQSTFEGLSSHILKALYQAAAFICVMHRRGDIVTPEGRTITRGSVWIEQEIAIAAFMQHVLGRSIPIYFYRQRGIGLEGIRSVLLMNPLIEFTHEFQVLDHLRSILPSATFTPYQPYDLKPMITHRQIGHRSTSDHHFYTLRCDVKNTGTQRVTDFQLAVRFPRRFLPNATNWGPTEDKTRSTQTHICLIVDSATHAPKGLYPGQSLLNPLEIEYFVDDEIFHDNAAMSSEIGVDLFSGSMEPKGLRLRIRDLQNF
jgi:hypothetical protein